MSAPTTRQLTDAWREAVWNGTDTPAMWRDELARRIRSFRAVSVANDPQRTYRAKLQECRKAGGKGYARQTGIGRPPKGDWT